MLDIITCCNDDRIADLRRLLASIQRHAPEARVRVIPFDKNSVQTRKLVADAGAEIQTKIPLWTNLGRRMYHGRGHYRPGVPMWTYFHKLNMFNEVRGPTVYLDANCVLLSGERPPLLGPDDILFHSTAMKGRNIPEAAGFVRQWAPGIGEGFNLGHCVFGPSVAERIQRFSRDIPRLHRQFLGPAPEQSFLTYAMAFLGLRARLLHDVDPTIAPTNQADLPVERGSDGLYRYTKPPFAGLRLISAKQPGQRTPAEQATRTFSEFD
jgi:hypothetical protein